MGSALTIGLALGGFSAASSIMNSQQQGAQMRAQASALKAQAKHAKAQGEIEAMEIDRRKSQIRREFEQTQARNRSMLAAGNVDMGSGSALDVSKGNINMIAQDVADNAYQKALKEWETKANAEILRAQASNMEANAQQTSGFFPTLLNAAISGAGGFATGYFWGGGSIRNLLGLGEDTPNAIQLAQKTGTPVSKLTMNQNGGIVWGHPSGKTAFYKP